MMKNRLTKGLLIAALGLVECTTTKLETRSDSSVSMQDEYAGLTREQIAELEIKKNNAEATRALIDEARAKQGVLLTSDDIVCGFNSSSGFLYQDAFKRMLTTHFPAQPSAEARIVLGNGYVFTPDGRVYDLGQLVDTKRWGSSYDVLCQTVYPKRDPIDITDKLKKYDPNLQKALDSMILEKIRTEKDKAK